MEIKCPICHHEIKEHFCPECGLPAKLSFVRPEYKSFKEYQHCENCKILNPFSPKYCQNCGKRMHEYVDLGLSVLWSKKKMQSIYSWLDSTARYYDVWPPNDDLKRNGKDAATEEWGFGWRIPTKDEFEELIEKCTWKKVIIPNTSDPALKVIGPNGNFIYFPVGGDWTGKSAFYESWTLTEDEESGRITEDLEVTLNHAYSFCYFESFNIEESSVDRRNSLWLSTPLNELKLESWNKVCAFSIHPVADKKWQGKL